MREIRFSIKHKGCWSSDYYKKFPEVRARLISILDSASYNPKSRKTLWPYLWKIEAKDAKQLDAFLAFFEKHKSIKKVNLISKTDRFAIVQEYSRVESASMNITIHKNNCYAVWKMSIDHGFERWQVLAENPRDLTNLIQDLKELGELIVEKIGKYEPSKRIYNLTEKQENALKTASMHGYFDWPRKINLEELAAISNLSRRTFQDHLRKAEAKIMGQVVGGL